ncbi:iron-regulated ABC transporter permease protein SufD [Luteibacter rhizovicinus]|uniref:Iron-regulated ABC transporter permease protein SufD n=1 Tax=Luteibacter rhizovicinus TaxID=242606 RepID=A0A4R3YML8_9GAMM|nr:Fe-S cluster assembly protein SufD [Luteibacter rhizovicinus]TCV94055.1 iron-regulated ABC transporter permease protein SufD [Luteibacter rhizovicinus]
MTEVQASRTPFVQAVLDAEGAEASEGTGIVWLDTARRENLDAFLATGLPEGRSEAWKYTPLRALAQRAFAPADADAARAANVDAAVFALPGVTGPRIVLVDGVFRADLSVLDTLPSGLRVEPLSVALTLAPEPLRFALAARHRRDAADAFLHLNAALARDGVVVNVAEGCTIESPVHVVYVATQNDVAWHARALVEVGQGGHLNVVEHHVAIGDANALGTVVSDFVLRDDAVLELVLIQDASAAATLVRRSHARVGARAAATVHAVELGGALVRHELTAELVGEGARFDSRGVFALKARQHIDTQMDVRHQARDTTSDALWRGVADGRSRGVFRGAIVVAEGADGSDAALSNKNLLLSAQAEIDTKPELEIYADEVKAAHGATIGQLDERSMFYLRSRGIPQVQARSLLTLAFCRAALGSLPNEALREHLGALLVAHLPTGPAEA